MRWWDGAQWTDRLQEHESDPQTTAVTATPADDRVGDRPTATPSATSAPSGSGGDTPFYTKKWFIGVAAGLVGLALGAATASGATVEDDPKYKDMSSKLSETKSKLSSAESEVAGVEAREAKAQEQEDSLAKAAAALKKQTASVEKREKAVGIVEDDIERNTIPGDGVYIVGDDIKPGTYRSTDNSGCYWQRSSSLKGDFESIIANGNVDGSAVITIAASDKGFTSTGCNDWKKVR